MATGGSPHDRADIGVIGGSGLYSLLEDCHGSLDGLRPAFTLPG